MDYRTLCKTPVTSISDDNRKVEEIGKPFEPDFVFGNSFEIYTDNKFYYVRMKFAGMLISKKSPYNYKP